MKPIDKLNVVNIVALVAALAGEQLTPYCMYIMFAHVAFCVGLMTGFWGGVAHE